MQIKNITYGMTYRGYKNYRECLNMLECLRQYEGSEVAKERARIIKFYEEFGEKATKKAFGADRKVISRWKQRLKENKGNIRSLIPISTKPNNVRKSKIDPKIIEKIKEIRQERYNLSKYKIKVFIDEYCKQERIKEISESSIGLIIKKNNMFYQPTYNLPIHKARRKKERVERVKYSPKVKEIGYIVADTVVVRENGITRYFYNAIDVRSRFSFSYYFKEQTSSNMIVFYNMFKKVFPYKITTWQNDNGHENLGDFQKLLKEEKVKQIFSYPRCPKINAYIERFNRIFREEFLNIHGVLMKDDLFDELLIDWLIYYNSQRPHFSLNLKSPLQFMIQNYKMSHMLLTNTLSCFFQNKFVQY